MADLSVFSSPLLGIELCLGLISLLIWRRYCSPLRDIPGPFLASFTRLWHVGKIFAGDQNLELIRLHDQHGHFVRIADDEVSVSHLDGIKKLLLAPIPKGYWYSGTILPDYRFVAPMSVTDPKAKIALSKALSSGYTLSNILRSEDAINRNIELLLGWLDKFSSNNQPMNFDEYLAYTTFDIVGEVIFSKPFGFLTAGYDIDHSIANSGYLSLFIAFASFYKKLCTLLLTNPVMTWLQILPMGHVYNTAMKAVDERQKNVDARFDVVAHWFRTHEKMPKSLTMRNIYAQATNNVGAGADTVNCALQSFIYYTIRNPDYYGRMREEIQQAQEQGMCEGKVVTYADAQKLPYLQACIKEALRFFHPVPMGLPRTAPAGGISIGDRTFPEGTILSISPWVVHLSTEIWGEDAREFNPDRWFREDAVELEKKFFIPFGAGYNSCPGHNIAKLEISKIAATIVRDYDIRQVDKSQEWKWRANFTLVPHSWPIYVERRVHKSSHASSDV
ncbi:cytochrome P450 [Pseudomassariella vexata]|uniref:Cytochrome P450 n=1 Tax=Pseudomassariella vexata TaxID=1141098 RepID=A0A1Y2DCF2_9PEZI|nr:cytochrome P450 [Pseudomassariella vexata]ORY56949.1 cytochrome P450 [Pseudomassariella vexata]